MRLPEATRYELTRIIGVGLLALLVGTLTGKLAISLTVGALAYLAGHFYYLVQAIRLLRQGTRLKTPFPGGYWGEIYGTIDRLQARARKRKRGLSRFAQRFREVSSAIPDALVIIDKDDTIEWVNPASRALLGISWPACVGAPISEIFRYPFLKEYLDTGDYSRALELSPTNNKALVLSVRITGFGGKKRQRLLVARDITKVAHINQIRRDFVANVSHELRTPLTVIAGFLENLLLGEDRPPPQIHRPLMLMQKQAERMQSIIDDLLTLSRLEMSDRVTNQEPIDVPKLVDQIVEEARTLSGEPGHPIEAEVDRQLWLLGNEVEIRSAFSNLVFNAVRHTAKGTRIQIKWGQSPSGASATFEVSDSGDGIEATHIPRLTERFYRVDKGRSRESGGTGLGLAIVKHILNRHEAELFIRSKKGVGSSFSCHFPRDTILSRDQFVTAKGDKQTTGAHGATG